MASKKWTLGFGVLVAALGLWAGFESWHSPSVFVKVYSAMAIFIGANLLFMTWLWSRALPGSGDRLVLPVPMLLSASMLIGFLPRLVWPDSDNLQIAASVVSIAFTAAIMVFTVRQSRKLRAAHQSGADATRL